MATTTTSIGATSHQHEACSKLALLMSRLVRALLGSCGVSSISSHD